MLFYFLLEAWCMDLCTGGDPSCNPRGMSDCQFQPGSHRPGQGTPLVHGSVHRASSMHIRSLVNIFPPSPSLLSSETHQLVPCFHACALSICPLVVSAHYSYWSNGSLGFYIYRLFLICFNLFQREEGGGREGEKHK
uniref:Uncharacterized protein n=1 Tax=Pipistrellus kuhlii TaxID=59472 RepID=A0A7J7Y9M9_PIPKU|nr:hypothetical protein mPipKuh1_010360 [Pipistrellus kuhlii]